MRLHITTGAGGRTEIFTSELVQKGRRGRRHGQRNSTTRLNLQKDPPYSKSAAPGTKPSLSKTVVTSLCVISEACEQFVSPLKSSCALLGVFGWLALFLLFTYLA